MGRLISKNSYVERLLADSNYDVRIDGTVWTLWSTNGISITSKWRRIDVPDSRGYRKVFYKLVSSNRGSTERRKVHLLAHRLVYRKYVGKLILGLVINHKNGIKDDNIPSNLEQVTVRENNIHSILFLGNRKGSSKLDEVIVKEIRLKYLTGKYSLNSLAREYEVVKSTISYIVNGKTWN